VGLRPISRSTRLGWWPRVGPWLCRVVLVAIAVGGMLVPAGAVAGLLRSTEVPLLGQRASSPARHTRRRLRRSPAARRWGRLPDGGSLVARSLLTDWRAFDGTAQHQTDRWGADPSSGQHLASAADTSRHGREGT
jgi:hypothetical protein